MIRWFPLALILQKRSFLSGNSFFICPKNTFFNVQSCCPRNFSWYSSYCCMNFSFYAKVCGFRLQIITGVNNLTQKRFRKKYKTEDLLPLCAHFCWIKGVTNETYVFELFLSCSHNTVERSSFMSWRGVAWHGINNVKQRAATCQHPECKYAS